MECKINTVLGGGGETNKYGKSVKINYGTMGCKQGQQEIMGCKQLRETYENANTATVNNHNKITGMHLAAQLTLALNLIATQFTLETAIDHGRLEQTL